MVTLISNLSGCQHSQPSPVRRQRKKNHRRTRARMQSRQYATNKKPQIHAEFDAPATGSRHGTARHRAARRGRQTVRPRRTDPHSRRNLSSASLGEGESERERGVTYHCDARDGRLRRGRGCYTTSAAVHRRNQARSDRS